MRAALSSRAPPPRLLACPLAQVILAGNATAAYNVTTELLRVTLPVNDTGGGSGGGGGWGDGGASSSSSSEVHSTAERVLQPLSREVAVGGAPWQRMVREVRCSPPPPPL